MSLARSATKLDWAALEIPTGLRGMIGVAMPLALGLARAAGVVAATRRYALAALALHAHLEQGAVPALAEVASLARQLQLGLATVASTLESGTLPPMLPDLRAAHVALAHAWSVGHTTGPDSALVLAETDLMVDGINTVAELLGGRSHGRSPSR
ncbi:MAG: hypothetical protein ACJ79S_04030 [Gemmatimonadaceae bacterium]